MFFQSLTFRGPKLFWGHLKTLLRREDHRFAAFFPLYPRGLTELEVWYFCFGSAGLSGEGW